MRTHELRGPVSVAFRNGGYHPIVLVTRADNPIALAKLGSAKSAQSRADSDRLFSEKIVVCSTIEFLVKCPVEGIICIEVVSSRHGVRSVMELNQVSSLQGRHAKCGEPHAHRLDL